MSEQPYEYEPVVGDKIRFKSSVSNSDLTYEVVNIDGFGITVTITGFNYLLSRAVFYGLDPVKVTDDNA